MPYFQSHESHYLRRPTSSHTHSLGPMGKGEIRGFVRWGVRCLLCVQTAPPLHCCPAHCVIRPEGIVSMHSMGQNRIDSYVYNSGWPKSFCMCPDELLEKNIMSSSRATQYTPESIGHWRNICTFF